MDVFRTKLYQYYPGKEATEKEMLENVSKTFQDYPNSDDIVYVIESNQEGYVKEISTGLLLPVFKGLIIFSKPINKTKQSQANKIKRYFLNNTYLQYK